MRIPRFVPATLMLMVAPCPAFAASLRVTPARVDFRVQPVHSESQAATVTLTNDADRTIQLSGIIASGIDFVATNDCKTELAPGGRCSIQIRFKPLIAGDRIGIVEILASDSVSPHFVPLTGKGQ